jgi:hypothetical protein
MTNQPEQWRATGQQKTDSEQKAVETPGGGYKPYPGGFDPSVIRKRDCTDCRGRTAHRPWSQSPLDAVAQWFAGKGESKPHPSQAEEFTKGA